MPLLKTLCSTLLIIISSYCFAGIRALSPYSLAEIEADQIARLTFQTGCAVPDLSGSNVDGVAVLEISFARDAKPLAAEIISSNGSDADNAKIIEALTKRCQYVSEPATLPVGVTKQFTYTWKAHRDSSGLRGCMVYLKYPSVSLYKKEEGRAVVSYRYLAGGSYESKISQSTGYQRLDNETLTIMNKCLENRALPSDSDANKWLEVAMSWRMAGKEVSSDAADTSSSESQKN